eukprot:CAMPEP_0185845016 /NCGR_PEP_ID=MMETSP1354-20130828/1086_1 /TAXON_ID=708628 /ORGANISM="Erythrolobus madagascarensis, Strain CCMP3276" /LENGTH=174 /DNA_ID=CAMNT_0028544865 /DNA_START=197 /DNA_END=721 /DNA_ORIENTATION=+
MKEDMEGLTSQSRKGGTGKGKVIGGCLKRGDSGSSDVTVENEELSSHGEKMKVEYAVQGRSPPCSSVRDLSPSELESLLEEEFADAEAEPLFGAGMTEGQDEEMDAEVTTASVSWDELDVIMGQKELNLARDAEGGSVSVKRPGADAMDVTLAPPLQRCSRPRFEPARQAICFR